MAIGTPNTSTISNIITRGFIVVLALCSAYQVNAFSSLAAGKQQLLDSLSTSSELNDADSARTQLLENLCRLGEECSTNIRSIPTRDSEWRVVYAPHMSAMGRLLRARFAPVIYQFDDTNGITSHARVQLPFLPPYWLSVSGTFSMVSESTCRVDFTNTWMKQVNGAGDDAPYETLNAVSEGFSKSFVNALGKFLFIEQVAVFPVLFLDDDCVVFDFELLGTRICALRQESFVKWRK